MRPHSISIKWEKLANKIMNADGEGMGKWEPSVPSVENVH